MPPVISPSNSLVSPIEVKESPIHGFGLFAAADLTRGQHVGTYEGPATDEDDTYVLWVEKETGGEVYGVDGQNELRYVNHSSKPNVEFDGEELFALRKIAAGEELTVHYGEEWD
jgi:uncharacterized protein